MTKQNICSRSFSNLFTMLIFQKRGRIHDPAYGSSISICIRLSKKHMDSESGSVSATLFKPGLT